MKKITLLLFCTLFSWAIHAAETENRPDKALALEYLETAQYKEAVDVSLDVYRQNFKNTPGISPAAAEHLGQMLQKTLGWEATKDQLAEIVAEVFTADELRAAIAYMKTPLGASATAKTKEFTTLYSTFLSQRVEKFANELQQSTHSTKAVK